MLLPCFRTIVRTVFSPRPVPSPTPFVVKKGRSRPGALVLISFEEEDGSSLLKLRDPAFNPEQVGAHRQQTNQLLDTVRKLDPRSRTVIEAQLVGLHSMKEIADRLNISVPAVKARLHRARACLAMLVATHSGAKKCMRTGAPDKRQLASR